MTTGIALLVVFLFMAFLMVRRILPALLALPIMAVLIGLVARVPIFTEVLAEGSIALHKAMIVMIFGSILGQFMNEVGISRTAVRYAAEFSGDRPVLVAMVLMTVTAVLFTVLGGLGAVIMVGTIVLPILLSLGIAPVVCGGILLLGISVGGILNFANWQLYISILGLTQIEILRFALWLFGAALLVTAVFANWEIRRRGSRFLWAKVELPSKDASLLSLLTPIIPIALIIYFAFQGKEFPMVSALILGLLYGIATARIPLKRISHVLSKSIIEGVQNVAPAIALLIGIGMVFRVTMHPHVAQVVSPVLTMLLPRHPFAYILFFGLLAPLALYRGPFNVWGIGSGLAQILKGVGVLPGGAIMAALLSVGQIQGISDPTNTHNVWIANFLKVEVVDLLKVTIFYAWTLAIAGLAIGAWLYF